MKQKDGKNKKWKVLINNQKIDKLHRKGVKIIYVKKDPIIGCTVATIFEVMIPDEFIGVMEDMDSEEICL